MFLTSAISICQEAGFEIAYKQMPSGRLGLFIPGAKWEGAAIVLAESAPAPAPKPI